jgi:acetyl-CoA carboxylase, biotin carboxylase subunit
MTWAPTRDEAFDRMARALREMRVDGIHTSIPYHLSLLADQGVRANDVTIDYVGSHLESWATRQADRLVQRPTA